MDLKNATKTAKEVQEKFNVACKAFYCDISDSKLIYKLKDDIEKEMRGVDILIMNAALIYMDDFLNSNIDDIQKVVQVNLTSQIVVSFYKIFNFNDIN